MHSHRQPFQRATATESRGRKTQRCPAPARGLAILLSLALGSTVAGILEASPLPLGDQVEVNTHTPRDQSRPKVAHTPNGSFLVAWESQSSPTQRRKAILGQWYEASGDRLGEEFQITSPRVGSPDLGDLAALQNGDVVAVWATDSFAGTDFDTSIDARILSPSGANTREFRVSPVEPGDQRSPRVAAGSDDSFIVTWIDAQIRGQRFWSDGLPFGATFQIENLPDGRLPTHQDLVVSGIDEMTLVWMQSVGDDTDVWARRFSAAGEPLGGLRQVGTVPGLAPTSVEAAVADGTLHVAWGTFRFAFGSIVSLHVRSFQANDLTPLSPALTIRDQSPLAGRMAIGAESDGPVVMTWLDDSFSGDAFAIRGQELSSEGALVGDEFEISTWPAGFLATPAIEFDDLGRFTVVWSSETSPGPDTSGESIQARRFLTNESPRR